VRAFHVADPVIVGTGGKHIVESMRREHGEAACAAAADQQALGIRPAGVREMARTEDRVLDVFAAPVRVQAAAIGAAESRRATVIEPGELYATACA
jgi:hypothetical protein